MRFPYCILRAGVEFEDDMRTYARFDQVRRIREARANAHCSILIATGTEWCTDPEAMMWQGIPRRKRPRRWAHSRSHR